MVECRQHQSPQDVQWIEELIGRRVSLPADSAIAVSSSGFRVQEGQDLHRSVQMRILGLHTFFA
jgi:hypothetical protein